MTINDKRVESFNTSLNDTRGLFNDTGFYNIFNQVEVDGSNIGKSCPSQSRVFRNSLY